MKPLNETPLPISDDEPHTPSNKKYKGKKKYIIEYRYLYNPAGKEWAFKDSPPWYEWRKLWGANYHRPQDRDKALAKLIAEKKSGAKPWCANREYRASEIK